MGSGIRKLFREAQRSWSCLLQQCYYNVIHANKRADNSLSSHGLEPTLTIHKDKLVVAPPGFDSTAWDPSVDKFLPQNYSADNMKGKSVCKVSLQQHLRLQEKASIVLVGCIFSDISDIELDNLKMLIWMASAIGVQFLFMGSGQTPGLNTALEYFEEELMDENMRFLNKYDEALAHLVLAGSDIMLCPSFDDNSTPNTAQGHEIRSYVHSTGFYEQ